ncbi:MAG: T9SS type A sorting domain-containing protein [Lentimicrobium sp.]
MKKRTLITLLMLFVFQTEIYTQSLSREMIAPMVPDSVITWKFNSQGDSALNTRMTYLYDAHLNVIESEKFTREQALHLWVPNRRDEWEFDSQDRQTLWAIYEWDNTAMAYKGFIKQTNKYDNHGNRFEYQYYTWDHAQSDWLNYSWDLYNYDAQNKITRGDHFKWNYDAEQWDTASYDIYEYGEDDLLQHLTIWEPDEDFGGIIYPHERRDYQYDASGNVSEWVGQIYNPNTELWYFTIKNQYAYDVQNRKTNSIYSEYEEADEKWVDKEKDEWGWDDSDSLTLYAYYRIGEDLITWYPQLKAEMSYNSLGKLIHYRGYSGNEQAQWVPTYERRYGFMDDILPLSDSLFQWIPDDETWEVLDCHNYVHDTLSRMHTDSYYAWVVHTHQLELSTRSYYFYPGTAGVEEKYAERVVVYPNPTTGKLKVHSAGFDVEFLSIEFTDIYGKCLKAWKHEPGTRNPEFDITHLPSGIYFIRLIIDNQLIVKSIVKL